MIWLFKKKDSTVAKPMDEARAKKSIYRRLFICTALFAMLPAFLCAGYMAMISLGDTDADASNPLASFFFVFLIVFLVSYLFLLPLFAVMRDVYNGLRKVVTK